MKQKQNQESLSKPKFPIFLRNVECYDFWKLVSEKGGHFIRNMVNGERYCYQSNDLTEGEVWMLMSQLDKYQVISEKEYLEAVLVQVKRNNMILKRLEV